MSNETQEKQATQDEQGNPARQAEETKSGSQSEKGPHEQGAAASVKPSSPGETGTTPGTDWK